MYEKYGYYFVLTKQINSPRLVVFLSGHFELESGVRGSAHPAQRVCCLAYNLSVRAEPLNGIITVTPFIEYSLILTSPETEVCRLCDRLAVSYIESRVRRIMGSPDEAIFTVGKHDFNSAENRPRLEMIKFLIMESANLAPTLHYFQVQLIFYKSTSCSSHIRVDDVFSGSISLTRHSIEDGASSSCGVWFLSSN